MTRFKDPNVASHFDSYPPDVQNTMLALREQIFQVAAGVDGVGELQETLKWGEPAYLTAHSKSGTTVRIDWKAKTPDRYAMYVHCQTDLVRSFRVMFPDLEYEGDRALILQVGEEMPVDALRVCIEAALTYHLRRKLGLR